MFKDEQAERKEYEERRKRGCEEVDPWFGHTATDVTYALHPPVPKHSSHPRLECAPDPCYNRTSTDVTAPFDSRPNNAAPDYYYGRQDTDVTAHLQVPIPKFSNPHGCASQCCTGKRNIEEEHQTSKEAHSHNQRVFDYMHPLGSHRPFPLSDYYYHSGSKPSTPCGSRSHSPSRRPRSRSPTSARRRRSKSRRSRSPSPERKSKPRSRSPSPEPCASYAHLPPQHNIPRKYLQCSNRCQLSPPCQECARLLDEDRHRQGISPCQAGMQYPSSPSGHQGGRYMKRNGEYVSEGYDSRGPHAARTLCPFHETDPCPLQAGYPCYGKRPWSPNRNSPRAQ